MAFCANPLHLGMQFEIVKDYWLVYDPVPDAPDSDFSATMSPLHSTFGRIYDARAVTGPMGERF